MFLRTLCAATGWEKRSHFSLFQQRKNRIKRHGVGIVLPVPCRFAVIGFWIRGLAGHRVDGPGGAAGGVQLLLFLFRELLVGNEFLTCATLVEYSPTVYVCFIKSVMNTRTTAGVCNGFTDTRFAFNAVIGSCFGFSLQTQADSLDLIAANQKRIIPVYLCKVAISIVL